MINAERHAEQEHLACPSTPIWATCARCVPVLAMTMTTAFLPFRFQLDLVKSAAFIQHQSVETGAQLELVVEVFLVLTAQTTDEYYIEIVQWYLSAAVPLLLMLLARRSVCISGSFTRSSRPWKMTPLTSSPTSRWPFSSDGGTNRTPRCSSECYSSSATDSCSSISADGA